MTFLSPFHRRRICLGLWFLLAIGARGWAAGDAGDVPTVAGPLPSALGAEAAQSPAGPGGVGGLGEERSGSGLASGGAVLDLGAWLPPATVPEPLQYHMQAVARGY
jgi:hypothetical protein